MQSTGHTSTHASQPVQLSALTTASSGGIFLRALPAPLAMTGPHSRDCFRLHHRESMLGMPDVPALAHHACVSSGGSTGFVESKQSQSMVAATYALPKITRLIVKPALPAWSRM